MCTTIPGMIFKVLPHVSKVTELRGTVMAEKELVAGARHLLDKRAHTGGLSFLTVPSGPDMLYTGMCQREEGALGYGAWMRISGLGPQDTSSFCGFSNISSCSVSGKSPNRYVCARKCPKPHLVFQSTRGSKLLGSGRALQEVRVPHSGYRGRRARRT